MSYILDALKKSEQERKLGQVPELATVHESAYPAPPEHPWRVWVAVVGVALVAAIGAWFFVQRTPPSTSTSKLVPEARFDATQSVESAHHGIPSESGTQPAPHSVQTSPTFARPIPLPERVVARPEARGTIPAGHPIASAAPASVQGQGSVASRVSSKQPDAERTTPAMPPAPKPRSSPHQSRQGAPNAAIPARQPSRATPQSKPAPVSRPTAVNPRPSGLAHGPAPAPVPLPTPQRTTQSATESTAGIPSIEELPVALRQTLPRMQINIHAYDADPQKRFVLIDMHRYKEKQTLEGGAVVDAITPDGVVLEYQGRRFVVPRQ